MAVKAHHFKYVQELAKQLSAIALDPSKEYLIETRLAPLAKQEGYGSLEDLLDELQKNSGNKELQDKVVDALTTNETSFFRDIKPFEALKREILGKIIERRKATRTLYIWSAACSTGQEPYSLAMMIREKFPELKDWYVQIYATDISPTVLAKAKSGVYNQLEVNRGLPAIMLVKYFQKKSHDEWVLNDDIRHMVKFEPLNLIQSWPSLPIFDVVLIRNVMIYFDMDTKKQILGNICKHLHDEGYLFLGASESILNLETNLKPKTIEGGIVYQRE